MAKRTLGRTILFLAFVLGTSVYGVERKVTLHIVKVTTQEEGYSVEGRTDTVYYYMSCTHKLTHGTACLHFHAGQDYKGEMWSPAPNSMVEKFVPDDAPAVTAESNGTHAAYNYQIGYTVDGEAEVSSMSCSQKKPQ